MNYSKKTVTVVIALIFVAALISVTNANASHLSSRQKKNADRIAREVSKNWEKYGCLPSVAVCQAFIESGLGVKCPNNNQWGISGHPYYATIEKGCIGYMKVINNGYYKKAPFCRDYRTQLRRILAGGYCKPVGSYYSDAVKSIQKYGWFEYDRKIFKQIEEERKEEKRRKKLLKEKKQRQKLQKKKFTFTYSNDSSMDQNTVYVSNKVSKDGAIILRDSDNKVMKVFNCISIKTKKSNRFKIITSYNELDGNKTKLEFREGSNRKKIIKKEGVVEMLDKNIAEAEELKMKQRQKEQAYSGTIKFQSREYKITEIHNPVEVKDKWVIGFEMPNVNHKARVFSFGVRYKDFERFPGDEEKIDRLAIFDTKMECEQFMDELYFPKFPLRAVQLTDGVIKDNFNPDTGAYLVKRNQFKKSLILPSRIIQ